MSLDRFESFGYLCAYESFMAFSFNEDDIATEGIGEKIKFAVDAAKRAILGLLKKIREGIQNAIRAIQRKFRDKTLRIGLSKTVYEETIANIESMGKIVSLIEDLPPISSLATSGSEVGFKHAEDRRSEISSKLVYINSEVAKLYHDMKNVDLSKIDDDGNHITIDPHTFVKKAEELAERVRRVEVKFSDTVFNGNNENILKEVREDSEISNQVARSIMAITSAYVSQCQKIVSIASQASAYLLNQINYMAKIIENTKNGRDPVEGVD